MRMLINYLPLSLDATVSSEKRTFDHLIMGQNNLGNNVNKNKNKIFILTPKQ